jgi:hypothetical protein
MDYTYRERHGEAVYWFKGGMLPSDFFRRNVVWSFQKDAIAIRLRYVIGVDNMMWSSDYTHSKSTFPQSRLKYTHKLQSKALRNQKEPRNFALLRRSERVLCGTNAPALTPNMQSPAGFTGRWTGDAPAGTPASRHEIGALSLNAARQDQNRSARRRPRCIV